MVSSIDEDAFLDEVLGLFVLEAQEWIGQSNTALLELEHHPGSDRKDKLCETISCGIANLGGSAATVELRDLEKLAFALLPLLQPLQQANRSVSRKILALLRLGLNAIIDTVQHLGDTKSDAIADLDQLLNDIETVSRERADSEATTREPGEEQGRQAVESKSVADRLYDLQRQPSPSLEPTRHTVDAVIRQAKQQHGERGFKEIDAGTVLHIVDELAALDDRLLDQLRQRFPVIEKIFSDIQGPEADSVFSDGRLEQLMREIHAAHDEARSMDMKAVMLFLHGLQSFLTLLSQKCVTITKQRIEGVASRLQTLLPSAERWVEIGRLERQSIQQILTHH